MRDHVKRKNLVSFAIISKTFKGSSRVLQTSELIFSRQQTGTISKQMYKRTNIKFVWALNVFLEMRVLRFCKVVRTRSSAPL